MDEQERRSCGVIRISMHSIIKALYGENSGYKAMAIRIDRYDRSMLELTISHPALPETKPGKRLPRIEVNRQYEQTKE